MTTSQRSKTGPTEPGSSRGDSLSISFERILIVRLSAFGDVVHSLPAFHSLRKRFPNSKIAWAAEDRVASLFEIVPGVDDIIVFPRGRFRKAGPRPWLWPGAAATAIGTIRRLRAFAPTIALDFQGNFKSAFHARASGAPVRAGFAAAKEGAPRLYTHVVPTPALQHRVDRPLEILRALGVPASPELPPIRIPDADRLAIDAWLRDAGIADPIVCHVGTSSFGSIKRWPLESWSRLGALLGAPVVFAWGPGERASAESAAASARAAGARAAVGPVTTGAGLLAALLKRASLFVGCDSGPLHLAAALGVPIVGLYGPKDPRIYGPRCDRHIVILKGLVCSPCVRRTCAINDCMNFITPEEVARAAGSLVRA